jgi:hypothetical protein
MEKFNRDEIDDLAYRLGIPSDQISGDTRSKRAAELVDYCRRHGMTEALVALIRQMRPEGES